MFNSDSGAIMRKLPVVVGEKWGSLTVIGENPINASAFDLICDCGTKVTAKKGSVRSGNTTSCGCKRISTLRSMLTSHGLRKHELYTVWADMRKRCNNPKHVSYANYGGRGIRVDPTWEDFSKFLEDMGDRPTSKHTLERKDTNGNYTPSNCIWATRLEQSVNTRKSLLYTYKGVSYSIVELCKLAEQNGVSSTNLKARLLRGVSVDSAVDTPVPTNGKRASFKKELRIANRSDIVSKYGP